MLANNVLTFLSSQAGINNCQVKANAQCPEDSGYRFPPV